MSHIITVKCDTCGHKFDIDIDNLSYESLLKFVEKLEGLC